MKPAFSPSTARERLLKGQFYTPFPLCDLILSLAWSPGFSRTPGLLLEPGCGEGRFIQRAMNRMVNLGGLAPKQALSRMVGVELDPKVAQQARLHLRNLVPEGVPHIITADFLSPELDPVMAALGPVGLVVGNPPYVRQEHWSQSCRMDKAAAMRHLAKACDDGVDRSEKLQALLTDRSADLYVWFFIQAARFLQPGGRLAFVTSNSWLDTAFGLNFRNFLTELFQVRVVLESVCERWFPEVAVNAVVVVLEKKDPARPAPDAPTRLLRLKQPLSAWMPDPESPDYWRRLDAQVAQMPVDAFTVKALDHEALRAEKSWSFALRAPGCLSRMLEAPHAWCRLDALGTVRYPLKTGINRFFYLSREEAARRGIEPEFLAPVVKSLKSLRTLRVTPEACDTLLFCCTDDKELLARNGKHGVLDYIRWGEGQKALPRQKRQAPVPWPEVPSVRGNSPWYAMRPLPPAHLLGARFLDRRFMFPLCDGAVMEDQTFYGITLPETSDPRFMAALLNSVPMLALLEFTARTSLGEGVLQFARRDLAALPLPSPALYIDRDRLALVEAFEGMASRPIESVEREMAQADRCALDLLALGPLLRAAGIGMSPRDCREMLYRALLARMAERAVMAGRAQKKKGNTHAAP